MKLSYDRLIDVFFIVVLLWMSIAAIYTVSTIPSVESLEMKNVAVEALRCSSDKVKSSALIKIDIGNGGGEYKLLQGVKECSEEIWGYLVGKNVVVFISSSSNLSIWGLQYESDILVDFDSVRSSVISESIFGVAVWWCVFAFIFGIRRFKKRQIKNKQLSS